MEGSFAPICVVEGSLGSFLLFQFYINRVL